MNNLFQTLLGAALAISPLCATASELNISLAGAAPVTHHAVKFQCDTHAAAMGLPSGAFKVDYVTDGNSSLAVLPIHGRSLIFAGVMSGSGDRYAAGQYIWWDAGSRGIHLYANPDSTSDKQQTACQKVQ